MDYNETILQLGGRGLHGALVYTGTRSLAYNDNALHLYVNGKRGETWMISIILDVSDTYTVRLVAENKAAKQLLDSKDDVYCDELQAVVEQMYDNAIKKYNGGFIPLD